MGVQSSLELNGASDGNSLKGPILPWLRSIDGLNTHDDAIGLAVAGGLTTSLILPGSANAIGKLGMYFNESLIIDDSIIFIRWPGFCNKAKTNRRANPYVLVA